MNAENCSPSTLAKTMNRSAKPPLVIHIFSPVIDHEPSASRVALRARAERVGAGSGLAQAVGADDLAAHETRQILLLLRRRAEAEDGHDREPRLCAEGRRERRVRADRLADDDGRELVEADAAKRLRDVRPEQPELAGARHQVPRHRPVLALELAGPLERPRWPRTRSAVCAISRCSSPSRSGVSTSSGAVSPVSQSPPRRVRGDGHWTMLMG